MPHTQNTHTHTHLAHRTHGAQHARAKHTHSTHSTHSTAHTPPPLSEVPNAPCPAPGRVSACPCARVPADRTPKRRCREKVKKVSKLKKGNRSVELGFFRRCEKKIVILTRLEVTGRDRGVQKVLLAGHQELIFCL